MKNKSFLTRISNMIISSPVIWGGLATLVFYAFLGKSTMNNPFFARYFESHPIEYVTAVLFFIGLAALVMKAMNLASQSAGLHNSLAGPLLGEGDTIEQVPELLEELHRVPATQQNSYLAVRLKNLLRFVQRKGSVDSLESQIHYHSDDDYAQMHASYSLVRIVIWAIPILGFLGTVVGITLAIGQMAPESLESSLKQVISGLGVAFDTTALALSLSIVLMFTKFFIERFEMKVLGEVDRRVNEELIGRFQQLGAENDPNAASIRKASEAIIASTENLIQCQAEIWGETMESAQERWASLTDATSETIESGLSEAIAKSIERHAQLLGEGLNQHAEETLEAMKKQNEILAEATSLHAEKLIESTEHHTNILQECMTALGETLADSVDRHRDVVAEGTGELIESLEEGLKLQSQVTLKNMELQHETLFESATVLAEENHRHLTEVRRAMTEGADIALQHQEQLVEQSNVLLKVVEATEQVTRLEEKLNSNLAALAGANNFEETVISLSAAVQLLSSRLGAATPKNETAEIQLQSETKEATQAA